MRVACFDSTSTTHACEKRKSPSNTRSSSRFLMLASSSALRGSVVTNAICDPVRRPRIAMLDVLPFASVSFHASPPSIDIT
jgi:hypothetical protein